MTRKLIDPWADRRLGLYKGLGRPGASSAAQKQRKCLRCAKMFDSAHAGNRLCGPCNGYANRVSPIAPEASGDSDED